MIVFKSVVFIKTSTARLQPDKHKYSHSNHFESKENNGRMTSSRIFSNVDPL